MCGMTTQQLWLHDVGRIQNVLDMLLITTPTAATVIDVPCTLALPPAPWPPAPLDRVWSKHWDTVANKWYYHNAATGDSTWSLLQPSERPPPPPLPFGWIAEWDDTHGRYYYYNAETRTSVWVPPVPLPPLHPCHTKLPSATIKPCKCFPPHVPATGSCHKSQLQVRATSAEKRSAEQPEILGVMERLDLLKDDSAAGGPLGGQAEGERGCCGAVRVCSRACTFSLEPARSGSAVTKELSDIVDGGTRGVATQEVAHHPGLSVDEQPACPGCRARPFGVPSPWIACGRCGQAPTEHCARCCPTGTQDLARHEADKCSAEQPEILSCMKRVVLLKDDRNLISKRTQRRPQVGEMREVEKTIASDGSRTWEMLGLPDTIATVEENMPFVPFSGRPSSIQQEIGERLVAPEEMKKYELGDDLQPIINKLDPTSWHPEAPPINPPTGKYCVHRQYWKQLESPPQDQQSLKDPTILQAMD